MSGKTLLLLPLASVLFLTGCKKDILDESSLTEGSITTLPSDPPPARICGQHTVVIDFDSVYTYYQVNVEPFLEGQGPFFHDAPFFIEVCDCDTLDIVISNRDTPYAELPWVQNYPQPAGMTTTVTPASIISPWSGSLDLVDQSLIGTGTLRFITLQVSVFFVECSP